MVTKQPEVTERTRQRMEDAFWQLYEKEPIEKITIKQVTDLAGYNRATFYLYYQNLYDLRGQIEDSLLEEREHFVDAHFTDQTPLETLRNETKAFLTHTQADAKYFKVLLGPHGDPAFVSRMNDFAKDTIRLYLASTPTGQSLSPTHLDYLTEFYAAGKLGIVRKWLDAPNQLPIDNLVDLLVRILTAL
ncbi:hypothetical protein KIMH_06070 [Bombiscardovia apis]|uniref:HTH tetR-type domain-containing protein n=1 Tax=Bombiscardovia apis TaxID=2932182 RepID=A0ABN6SGW0_9BIFI|nr:TetR-like C-terminal domain-containing protein [Bombiscardovia apis]BDR54496.1 hypothetical protein KIMH_06070 [Bombiscardovia apis]